MVNPLLEALSYVGSSLDKPGAAVRGLLAGRTGGSRSWRPRHDGLLEKSKRCTLRGKPSLSVPSGG